MLKLTDVIPDVIILAIIYVYMLKRWSGKAIKEKILYTLMYIYISVVIYLTLMPIITALPHILDHPYIAMKMNLFDDYYAGRSTALLEMSLNVLMTIPFGFMLPIIKNKKIIYTTFFTFLLTLSIEILQPLLHGSRVSDITDIFTNVLGGIIGYIIYLMLKPVIKKIYKNIK